MCHIRDETLQKWGSLALSNICEINGANQADLVAVECQRVLVFIMQAHKSNIEIQQNCITAFGRIATNNLDMQRAIMDVDGVRQIVKAMRVHNTVLELQILGAHTNRCMRFSNTMPTSDDAEEFQKYVIDSKAHNVMFSALSTFPESGRFGHTMFSALGNLGLRNETTQQVLVTDGLLELNC